MPDRTRRDHKEKSSQTTACEDGEREKVGLLYFQNFSEVGAGDDDGRGTAGAGSEGVFRVGENEGVGGEVHCRAVVQGRGFESVAAVRVVEVFAQLVVEDGGLGNVYELVGGEECLLADVVVEGVIFGVAVGSAEDLVCLDEEADVAVVGVEDGVGDVQFIGGGGVEVGGGKGVDLLLGVFDEDGTDAVHQSGEFVVEGGACLLHFGFGEGEGGVADGDVPVGVRFRDGDFLHVEAGVFLAGAEGEGKEEDEQKNLRFHDVLFLWFVIFSRITQGGRRRLRFQSTFFLGVVAMKSLR